MEPVAGKSRWYYSRGTKAIDIQTIISTKKRASGRGSRNLRRSPLGEARSLGWPTDRADKNVDLRRVRVRDNLRLEVHSDASHTRCLLFHQTTLMNILICALTTRLKFLASTSQDVFFWWQEIFIKFFFFNNLSLISFAYIQDFIISKMDARFSQKSIKKIRWKFKKRYTNSDVLQ